MATIVAIAYADEGTAEQAWDTVSRLEDELVLRVEQVATISRDVDGRFHVHTLHEGIPTAAGAIWGGFWGLLFGALFLLPLKTTLSDADTKKLQDALGPGSSADVASQQAERGSE